TCTAVARRPAGIVDRLCAGRSGLFDDNALPLSRCRRDVGKYGGGIGVETAVNVGLRRSTAQQPQRQKERGDQRDRCFPGIKKIRQRLSWCRFFFGTRYVLLRSCLLIAGAPSESAEEHGVWLVVPTRQRDKASQQMTGL